MLKFDELDVWARAAFSARCARRFLPLFYEHAPRKLRPKWKVIEKAISIAEQISEDGFYRLSGQEDNLFSELMDLLEADITTICEAVVSLTFKAFSQAIEGSNRATYNLGNPNKRFRNIFLKIYRGTDWELEAFRITEYLSIDVRKYVSKEINRDFDTIKKTHYYDGRTFFHRTVSKSFFGELWPKGTPKGWPHIDHNVKIGPVEEPIPFIPAAELESIEHDLMVLQKTYIDRFAAVLDNLHKTVFRSFEEKWEVVTRINQLARMLKQELIYKGTPVSIHCSQQKDRGTGIVQLRHGSDQIYARAAIPPLTCRTALSLVEAKSTAR